MDELRLSTPPAEGRLESWKEIAAFLKRDVRTVQRWEQREGLPVHRHFHESRGSVYAYAPELEAWRNNRPRLEGIRTARRWSRRLAWLGVGTAVLLSAGALTLWRARGGRWPFPDPASSRPAVIAVRRVWAGPEANVFGSAAPNGGYLSFTDVVSGDLAVRDLATGRNRRLTKASLNERAVLSVISPDSRRVAYGWQTRGRFYELHVVALDGSNPRLLYRDQDGSYIRPAAWSPDGKQVLAIFTGTDAPDRIALISVVDGSMRVLRTLPSGQGAGRVILSPEGRYVAYDSPARPGSPRDIYLLTSDGRDAGTLIQHPADDTLLGWTWDGTRVLFASDRAGSRDAWVVRVADGKPQSAAQIVRRNIGTVVPLGFTRDGSFYYGLQTSIVDVHVATLDPETGSRLDGPTPVMPQREGASRSPAWSPDGHSLAYISGSAAAGTIVIRRMESGEERQITPELGSLYRICWFRDGRSLLVMGTDKKNRWGWFRVELPTGRTRTLTDDSSAQEAVLAPDDRAVFRLKSEPAKQRTLILKRDLATGRESEVYAGPHLSALALSPDGRQLAFREADPESRDSALKVIPLPPGQPRELLQVSWPAYFFPVAWSVNGRYLLFGLGGPPDSGSTLWRVPVSGGTAQKLELEANRFITVQPHPDGRRLAFTAFRTEAEAWVMENFLVP